MKAKTDLTKEEIQYIIDKAEVCSIALVDKNNKPYSLIMNYGYKDGIFYFHSGPGGTKLSILEKNPEICITMSTDHAMRIQSEKVACSFSMRYKSVVAKGKVEFIDPENLEAKEAALNTVMQKYAPDHNAYKYSVPALKNVVCFKLVPEEITARTYGY